MSHIHIDFDARTKSGSEKNIAKAFNALSDDWDVWMNRKLNMISEDVSNNREADCILYHRTEGMIILECKDGNIYTQHDSAKKKTIWWQGDHPIQSPALQASSITPILHDFFKTVIRNEYGAAKPIRIQWAVFFGSMDSATGFSTAELPPQRTLLSSDVRNGSQLEQRLLDILHLPESSHGDKPFPNTILDDEEYDILRGLFNGNDVMPYSVLWDMEKNVRATPTLIQETIIDAICLNPRIKIQGAAGSGKSLLMMWEAERLAQMGKKVAVVCYNELLAANLAEHFNVKPGKKNVRTEERKIEVHELAKWHERYIRRSSQKMVERDTYEGNINEYYEKYLPELFQKALKELRKKKNNMFFDAILLDEGQDMKSSWIEGILKLLKDEKTGIIRFYYDPVQSMYNDQNNPRDWEKNSTIQAMPTLLLRKSYRSTKKILDWVSQITGKNVECYFDTPNGEKVQVKPCNGNSRDVLEKEVGKLVKKGINFKDILVVSLHSRNNSCLKDLDNKIFKWSTTFDKGLDKNVVNIVSSHRIKGLDSQVVIMVDFERPSIGNSYTNDMKNRIFVAATRAKSKLIVLEK